MAGGEPSPGTARMGHENAGVSIRAARGRSGTGRESELRLEAETFGQIDLGPDSELRAASTRQVQLKRGTLSAFIWARPGTIRGRYAFGSGDGSGLYLYHYGGPAAAMGCSRFRLDGRHSNTADMNPSFRQAPRVSRGRKAGTGYSVLPGRAGSAAVGAGGFEKGGGRR